MRDTFAVILLVVLFLSLVAPFSSSSVKEKVISLSLSLYLFFSLGGDHLQLSNRLFLSHARGAHLHLFSLSSRNHLFIIDDMI